MQSLSRPRGARISLSFFAVVLLVVASCTVADPVRSDPNEQAPILIAVATPNVTLQPGQSIQFVTRVLDQVVEPIGGSMEWSATGGSISLDGLYTAGGVAGNYEVTATETSTGISGSAVVTVATGPPGTAFYVDQGNPSANDNNPGTEASPWKTIKKAMATLIAGQTVFIKNGTYINNSGSDTNANDFNPANSGTASQPITIQAFPGHKPLLQNTTGGKTSGHAVISATGVNYIILDGLEVVSANPKAVVIRKTTGSIVRNSEIHGMRGSGGRNTDGIRIEQASNILIRNNLIYDIHNDNRSPNGAGAKLYESTGVIMEHNEVYDVDSGLRNKRNGSDNVFRYNWVHDCTNYGIGVGNTGTGSVRNLEAYGNIVARCEVGIRIYGVTDSKVWNNTVVDNSSLGISARPGGISNIQVWNNILYGSTNRDLLDSNGALSFCDYNLYWQTNAGCGSNSVVADPQFLNTNFQDPLDFKLLNSSPARAAGRNGEDIGAYAQGDEIIGVRR